MICQNCQKRLANVHFTQIINGRKVEQYLCEECAKDKGQVDFASPFGLSDLFTGLLGGYPGGIMTRAAVPQQLTCPACGMTFEQFREFGKMGCADCYGIFADRLNPIVRHLHGNVKHSGKVPGKAAVNTDNEKVKGKLKIPDNLKHAAGQKNTDKSDLIESLRAQLEAAIKEEKYEKAAELRDKIRTLENDAKK